MPHPSAALPSSAPPPANPKRPVCTRCALPLASCLCRWITPTTNQAHVLLLQHPQEALQAKGTARLLRLSLQHCECQVGEVFDAAVLGPASGLQTWLLYPAAPDTSTNAATSAAAPPLRHACADTGTNPSHCRLLLLDGTWRQARHLLRANPWLLALPRWPLLTPPPSRYRIRLAQRPAQRSTLEAACLALATLESTPERYNPLLAALDGWVASCAERVDWADRTDRADPAATPAT